MKTLLVALLLLIVGTGTAFAECAWVVWAYSLEKSTGEIYSVELARATKQECDQAVRAYVAVLKSDGFTVRGGEPGIPELTAQKGTLRVKYFCLPDTVDPRGPKGGGR